MMKALLAGVAAASALLLAAAPTAALADPGATVLDQPCQLVQNGSACFFSGNITLANLAVVDAAYNLQTAPNPDFIPSPLLDLAGAAFADDFMGNGSDLTGHVDADFLVEFFAVKAANGFALYWITPSDSFDWTTAGVQGGGHGVSHLVWVGNDDNTPGGGGVPEPATWAMMIMGFGGVGALMRRRRELTVA